MQTPPSPRPSEVPATRLVYLPTNRSFEAAFRSVVAEIEAVRADRDDDIRLLVVDDCAPEVSRANTALAEGVGRERGCDVQVLTTEAWRHLVREIVAGLPAQTARSARSALVKPTGSYGAGPNKAALAAAFIGAATLHRRDSDQITRLDPGSGRPPLDIEIRLLDGADAPGPGAYCAGSSLTGRPTRDRRDLEHGSREFTRRIDDLSRLPTAADGPRPHGRPKRGMIAGVAVERDHTGAVEMGIAAVRAVHEWIPEPPAVGILGSDYFQKNLLYQLGLPVFYHGLRALHVYEGWRSEQSDPQHLAWYAVAELRYSILRYHWNRFNEALKAERERLLRADGFDSALYGALFAGVLQSGRERAARIAQEFVVIYKEAASAASGTVRQRLDTRVAALEGSVDAAPHYVDQAIREFTGLARIWPALVTASARLGRRYGRRLPAPETRAEERRQHRCAGSAESF